MNPPISNSVFIFHRFAEGLLRNAPNINRITSKCRFRALFGVTPSICGLVWEKIYRDVPQGSRPIHLLWALLFLKSYATETVIRIITGVDEKTFRKWAWCFVKLMADVNVINWEDRYERRVRVEMVSVDGADFKICEPYPFQTKWYSHKFHGPGLMYEVGICIESGHIVWVNCPFPCGSHSDLKIFQMDIKKSLDEEEFVIADGGYIDERCKKLGETAEETRFYSVVRARHETLNRRMKHFNVLGQRFRHRLFLHSACFHAVAKPDTTNDSKGRTFVYHECASLIRYLPTSLIATSLLLEIGRLK